MRAFLFTTALVVGLGASPSFAQNQGGLVNVVIDDVTILEQVGIEGFAPIAGFKFSKAQ